MSDTLILIPWYIRTILCSRDKIDILLAICFGCCYWPLQEALSVNNFLSYLDFPHRYRSFRFWEMIKKTNLYIMEDWFGMVLNIFQWMLFSYSLFMYSVLMDSKTWALPPSTNKIYDFISFKFMSS